ncbi:TPA: conjugal transfer protein TraD [Legionella anisa]
MTTHKEIVKQKQFIARCEKSIALEKLKKRRVDTRGKIEFGGLVIKSGINVYNKAVILGALNHISNLIMSDHSYTVVFESAGIKLFKDKEN